MSTLKIDELPKFALVAAIGALYVFGGMTMSNLGMDWGYYLVDKVWHQTTGNHQWYGAIVLGSFIAPAIYGAMAVALAKRFLGGNKIWYGVMSLPLVYGVYMLFSDSHASEWGLGVVMLAGWFTFLVCCYRTFDWLVGELAKRGVAKLAASPALVFAPIAALALLDHFSVDGSGNADSALISSVVRYSAVLFAAGFSAPFFVRTQERGAAVAASMFALLPTMLFSVTNVLFASLFLHDAHAMLSSAMILGCTLTATTCGALAATVQHRR